MADRRCPTDPNAVSPQHDNVLNPKEDFLYGGGETGELIRSIDWSKTPLGSRDAWPESLRTVVNLILASSFPMAILWGSDLIYIYNDAYRVIAAGRHPNAMGKSIREVWPETWEFNKAVLERVMALGETVHFKDQLYRTARHGSMEDGYFTLSYSPIRSESGQVVGTLVVLLETTERKRSEMTLRQSEERLMAVAENLTEGLIVGDSQGQVLYWNQAALAMFGYASMEECRRKLADFADTFEVRPLNEDRLLPVSDWPMSRVLRGEVLGDWEVRLRRLDQGWEKIFAYSGGFIRSASDEMLVFVSVTDITKNKQTEEALRESTTKLEVALESMTEAIFIADVEGRFVNFNTGFARYHHFKDKEDCSKAITECPDSIDAYFPDGKPAPLDMWAMSRALRGETASNVEYMLRKKDTGETWWGSYNFAPIRDKDGKIAGGVVSARDITDRKRAEEALRRSERLYRAIGESIDYGVWVCAPDGRNIYASESFLKMVGITQEQCSNFGWGDVLHPDDVERTIAAWKECVRTGGTWDIEHRFRGVDGQWHNVLARGIPVRDEQGNITHWAGINLDIGDRKQMEEKLRESEERLRLAVEAADLGTWDLDLITGMAVRSLRHDQIFGYQEPQAEWTLEVALRHVLPEDRQKVLEAHTPAAGKTAMSVEARMRRADGSIGWVMSAGRFHYDLTGRPIRIVGVCADITERKKAEEEIRKALETARSNEEQLRVLVQNVGSAVALIDDTGRFSVVNRVFLEMFGLSSESDILNVNSQDWSRWEVYGEDSKLLNVDDHPVRKAAMTGKAVTGQLIAWRNPGAHQLRWMLINAEPLLREDGSVYMVICTYHDITERMLAEEALRKARDELELRVQERTEAIRRQADLIELSHEAIIVKDLESRILFWNRGAEEAYGWTKAEAEGNITHSFLKTRFPVPFDEYMAVLTREGRWEGELIHTRKDGSELTVLGKQVLQRDEAGTPIGIMEINIDITERKRAEIALQASEQRWATTLMSIGDAVIATDTSGRIVFMNAMAEALTGWTLGNAMQKPITEVFHIINEQTRLEVENPISRVLREGMIIGLANHTLLVKKDGTEVPIDDSGAPIRDKEGNIAGVVLIFRDITERKQAEEQAST